MSHSDLKIILSYRRADERGMAGRIYDWLTRHYGKNNVFRDIDSIPPGVDFRKHIRNALDQCDVLIAIVGPHWMREGERQRIHNENDFVRLEVETALKREIPVIPVLVEGTIMPRPDQLPKSLEDFAYREAVEVDSGRNFRIDVERLIRSLDRLFEHREEEAARQKVEEERPAREQAEEMFNLGMKHRDGKGVPQNGAEAVRWFRKAADLGNTDAMNRLGYMYLGGKEVPQNIADAVYWYRKAADLGDAEAMFNLGLMYQRKAGALPKTRSKLYAGSARPPISGMQRP